MLGMDGMTGGGGITSSGSGSGGAGGGGGISEEVGLLEEEGSRPFPPLLLIQIQ